MKIEVPLLNVQMYGVAEGDSMKIKELIAELSKLNPEMIVVSRGLDEGGFADIRVVKPISVQLRKSESARQSLGEYEEPSEGKAIDVVLVDHT